MITLCGNTLVTFINNNMQIHSKTKKIIKKILRYNISNNKDLELKLSEMCDSLKYLELLLSVEKIAKKKILNRKIIKIKDINNFFYEKK